MRARAEEGQATNGNGSAGAAVLKAPRKKTGEPWRRWTPERHAKFARTLARKAREKRASPRASPRGKKGGARPRGRPRKGDRGTRYAPGVKAAVMRELERGELTAEEISRKLGPSVFSIKDWKKKAGLTRGGKRQGGKSRGDTPAKAERTPRAIRHAPADLRALTTAGMMHQCVGLLEDAEQWTRSENHREANNAELLGQFALKIAREIETRLNTE